MIGRLRRKFVLIAAVSLLAVEVLLIGLINVINYVQISDKENALLDIICENGGEFPDMGMKPDREFRPIDVRPPEQFDMRTGRQGNPFKAHMDINPETRFQTRYFFVKYNASGEISLINTGHIAAVTAEDAAEYCKSVRESGKSTGYMGNYRYRVNGEDADSLYVFLDCTENFSTKQRFMLVSVSIALGGFVLVCLMMIVASKFAVKPFIENYEKQKRFISDAGHEIKTPLAIISANTEVLEMTGEPNEWTAAIRNQVERLNGLISGLLKLSKMEEDTNKPSFQEFDVSAAFEDIVTPFGTLASTKGLTLDIESSEGLKMTGDEESVRQLISILTDNAVKYCDGGGKITVGLYDTAKNITVKTVNDCAAPPEDTERLFDRFYRADTSRSRNENAERSGYGIGLSVAKAITAAHKGKIFCKAQDGKMIFTAVLKK